MRRLVLIVLLSSLLVTLPFMYKGNILKVKAISDMHQGDLILTGNNVTLIEGIFDINGSIIVEENATLILRDAILNFTQSWNFQFKMKLQNPSGGNPRLRVEHAIIVTNNYYLELSLHGNSSASVNRLSALKVYFRGYESSVMMMSNSSILNVGGMASPVVSLSNCSLYYAEVREDSNFDMFNCEIQILQAYSTNNINVVSSSIGDYVALVTDQANCSADRLAPGFVAALDFQQNCSILTAVGGWTTNLTLTDTQVNGWSFEIYSTSNVTISNSDLKSVYSFNSAELHSKNSTIHLYTVVNQSKVLVSWYLDVHVVDSIGQNVSSANVKATYLNATAVESRLTDANGWARLTLLEKMMNASGEYPFGNYTVEAVYDVYSNSTTVNIAGNQQITLKLEGFVTPEFLSFLILPLFMLVTLLVVTVFRNKHMC